MLTIFTIPKPFRNDINIIQRNAILSWKKLLPECEIILFGDEEGVNKTAKEFGILDIPEIKKSEYGTPVLNSIFNLTQKIAKNQILVYLNSDIILMSDFMSAIKTIKEPIFLMVGRRWDLDIREKINFNNTDWEEKLKKHVIEKGKLHGFSGVDYFVFPRDLPHNLPPFIVGRPGSDNWLIYRVRSLKIPVIDATEVTTVIHQNHESSHLRVKKDHLKKKEAEINLKLAGGLTEMATLRDANWILTPEGLKKPSFPRIIFAKLSLFRPWRLLLAVKRKIQRLKNAK